MTRSFQIIGQGLTRCHPHMLSLIDSLQSTEKDAPSQFMKQFGKMLGHVFSNLGLSWARGVGATLSTATRSSSAYKSPEKLVQYHEAQLLRLSANFAFAADLALLLGGRLKFEELMMGRLSDAMGAIFLGYSVLHHFERNQGSVKGLEALAESAMLQLETEAQTALRECAENFPAPLGSFGGLLMSIGVAPLGELMRPYRPPKDHLTKEVATLLTTPSEVHAMFAENVYQPSAEIDPDNRVAGLIRAMPVCLEADAALMSCKREKREPTTEEASLIAKANALRDILIQVDVHDNIGVDAQTERPALVGTALRQQKAGTSFEAVTGVSAAASA
jgi:acyl-CoA dehydrogenase